MITIYITYLLLLLLLIYLPPHACVFGLALTLKPPESKKERKETEMELRHCIVLYRVLRFVCEV